MKKVYTVIAALMLIFAMTSCSDVGSGKASSQITGTWKYTIDITDDFDQMSMDLIGSPTDATVEMVYAITFNEDGTYTLNVDRDALKTSLQTYIDSLIPAAVEMIYQQLEDQGMNRADIDEAMAAEGVTVEEYVQQMMDASIDVDQMMDGLADENESGYFRAAKGKLYLSDKADTFSDDSCAEYTLSGGTMQWTGGSYELFDNLDDLHVKLPVQWVKQ